MQSDAVGNVVTGVVPIAKMQFFSARSRTGLESGCRLRKVLGSSKGWSEVQLPSQITGRPLGLLRRLHIMKPHHQLFGDRFPFMLTGGHVTQHWVIVHQTSGHSSYFTFGWIPEIL